MIVSNTSRFKIQKNQTLSYADLGTEKRKSYAELGTEIGSFLKNKH